MSDMGITATEASKEIGCSVATVSRWCAALRIGRKYGSAFMLTPTEVKKISNEWKKTKGRPKDSGNSSR